MRWLPPDASQVEFRPGSSVRAREGGPRRAVARRSGWASEGGLVRRSLGEGGFSIIDLMLVLGIFSVLAGIGIPLVNTATSRLRLNQAVRDVERELQGAKQRAVATNRPIRVRFDCPSAGVYRAVELIGSPRVPSSLDSAVARCDDTAYPYPAADRDPMTRPNADGQVKRLPSGIAFSSVKAVEFWPDGTAHEESATNPWPPIASTGLTLTMTYASRTASIQVNGLGRITLDVQ